MLTQRWVHALDATRVVEDSPGGRPSCSADSSSLRFGDTPDNHRNVDPDIRQGLLGSIAANRLVVICGAGLSMARPTCLPSAKALAASTARLYETITGDALDPRLHDDLEALAKFIWERGQLRTLFIQRLVDWAPFRRKPNSGHSAIADLLLCSGIEAAVSTNYDTHIEDAAFDLGEGDFRIALDGAQAQTCPPTQRPLLKLHGCCQCDRDNTVWLKEQLGELVVSRRTALSRDWIRANLRQRDLIFVGFWSDWAYLNEVLERIVADLPPDEPRLAVLVDPDPWPSLVKKAPVLSEWAQNGAAITFRHAQEYAEVFLEELRVQISLQFVRTVLSAAGRTYEGLAGHPPARLRPPIAVSGGGDELYGLRRDLTGMGPRDAVRTLRPDGLELIGAFLLALLLRGATVKGGILQYQGQSLRVFNGAGKLMSQVRARLEAPQHLTIPVDEIICVNAFPDPSPPNIVRPGAGSTVVRPQAAATWRIGDELMALFT